jgi:hypothetical protein
MRVDQTGHLSPPLDCFLANAQDKAGHAAIRIRKQRVVFPIADLPRRLHHLVCRSALEHSKSVNV